jgi:predicted enzyme related to lactoylglutathione lyase
MGQAEQNRRIDYVEFPGGRRFHFTDPSGNELAVWSDR